jgi:hypothetical protein
LAKDSNVGCQAVSPNGLMPTAIIDAEQTESEPDEQLLVSPVHSSDLSDTNRIIDNLCNSPLPSPEFLQTCSNESENLHITTLPSPNHDMSDAEHFSSNLDMADPEDFARTYIPLDVKRALAKLDSKSSPHHMTSQQSSGEAYLRDSMDSEGQEVQLASQRKGNLHFYHSYCVCRRISHKERMENGLYSSLIRAPSPLQCCMLDKFLLC